MAVTLQAWLGSLQALLPPGRAFTREPGSVLARVLEALAAMLLAAQMRLEDLRAQGDPLRATTMMPDWERFLALPDACVVAPENLSLFERQQNLLQRLTEQGGQSAAYFIGLASQLGQPGCTVTEFRPMSCNDDCNDALFSPEDRFNWQFNVPAASVGIRVMDCNDDCNDPLDFFTPSLIECPIRKRRPAHTNVYFAYAS
ncbi:MAG: hypothetical protein B7Y42_00590 [Polaromonas sp. 28-63-22]|nr:MAG: hypothetical protein B7Y42_00590 [Polaromonas sp. 28-63-22]